MNDAVTAFDHFADDYEASRRLMIEDYDGFYAAIVSALTLMTGAPERILDLGAGTGLVSRAIRSAHPDCALTLLDGSAAMLEKARQKVAPPAEFLLADLRDELPAGPFDAVVSGMAIHHLPHPDQARLYRRAAAALRPGGIFINGEVIGSAGPRTAAAYHRNHHDGVCRRGGTEDDWNRYLHRQQADVCAPLSSHLSWLTAAGFTEADCTYKREMLGVLVGLT